ncbi:MAG: metalloprotease [Flavobacteriaceae bacterium]|nr:metalloprotease [Flavobacteriaceae bacterium]
MLTGFTSFAQNKIEINAKFDIENDQIHIKQYVEYTNTSTDTLSTIYLNDWSNSFSTKNTPLALRFTEEFSTNFHFAKNEERGFTVLTSVLDDRNAILDYNYLETHPDVLKVQLAKALLPQESYKINLDYIVKIPSDKFTRYGVNASKDYHLKYWYITPAIYDGKWHYFSNKNLDDLYVPKSDITLEVEYPIAYNLISELDRITTTINQQTQTTILNGNDRVDSKLFLKKSQSYITTQTEHFSLITNLNKKGISNLHKALVTDRIASFVSNYLGNYPHKKLLVTTIDIKKDPVYGLNQLPDFIRPFPPTLQFELSLLKSTLSNYLDNTLLLNPRKEHWLKDGIQIYFLMKYIEDYYPNTKLLGSFANFWGIRWFHASDLRFNEQYNLYQMHMQRTNRDQPLTMAKDSLLKFNKNIVNKYKAGVGLAYLDDFIASNILETTIKNFLEKHKIIPTNPLAFETYLKSQTSKDIDWFFKDFIRTRSKIDFKLKAVKRSKDSITFTVKNKASSNVPITLFSLNDNHVLSKQWLTNIEDKKTYTISNTNNRINRLVLNYDRRIPEINQRNNWKFLRHLNIINKPLQIRFLQDFENSRYSQTFLMPIVEFNNIYDGLTLGGKFYNKTLLRRNFYYKISPLYGLKSKSLTGSATISNTFNYENNKLYKFKIGLTGSYSSYAPNLFAQIIRPFVSFDFRNADDFRSNKRSTLNVRYVDITKDPDIFNISGTNEPDYKVFNIRYVNSNPGLINYFGWFTDFQLSKNFGKLSINYEYRKLYQSNRQLNFRFFAGSFIYNKNPEDLDYFSFALDRPKDYLFDYNYLGRSETTGIYSQQLIIAEGGLKSKLDTPFANRWMTTCNMSTTLWKYIQAYGDIGLVKNKGDNPKFVYDSGVRVNLVTDYFELYFPIYSNLGWEIAQPNYDQKIRFIFTVDPKTLLGLFRRKWY